MTSKYSVEARDQYGHLQSTLLRAWSREVFTYRNKAGSCQFTMSVLDPQVNTTALAINQNDIVIRRRGTPIFAGQLSYLNPQIDGDKKEVQIIATGYYDLFAQRLVNPYFPNYDTVNDQLVFNNTDCGAVISSLIDYTQFPLQEDGHVLMSDSTPTMCQSFVAPTSTTVSYVKLLLQNVSATGNLIVKIYDDLNGAPNNVLTNGSITAATAGISSSMAWYQASFSTPPSITNNQTYWIRCWMDTPQTVAQGIQWSYLNGDYYFNGQALSPENGSQFIAGQDLQFFVFMADNTYQQTKNTYLGLQQGVIQTSFTITRTYSKYKIIKEAIDEISKIQNGIDFAVTTSIDSVTNIMTRYYNVYYPRQGINNTALNFTYPGNIKKVGRSKDGKSMVNFVWSRGQGSGAFQAFTTSYDSTSQQAYGLREEVEDFSDIPDTSQLQKLGDELIRVRKDPLEVPAITLDGNRTPELGSYGLGDTILITITNAGILNQTSAYRIEEIHVTVDDDDMEEVELSTSLA